MASFVANSESKDGKGLLRKPTDFMASFVRSAFFVGSPPVPERVCSLSPTRSCRQRRSRKLARMVKPAWPPCWASSLIAMLQLVRNPQRSRKREPWVMKRRVITQELRAVFWGAVEGGRGFDLICQAACVLVSNVVGCILQKSIDDFNSGCNVQKSINSAGHLRLCHEMEQYGLLAQGVVPFPQHCTTSGGRWHLEEGHKVHECSTT